MEENNPKAYMHTDTFDIDLKKDNVTDLSLIKPTVMRESENMMSSLAMSKVLLERLLLRKELRLKNMQDKLEDQTQRLEAANKKLEEYEKMIGFKKILFLNNLCRQVTRFSVRKASGARRKTFRAATSLYQVSRKYCYGFSIFRVPQIFFLHDH